MLHCQILYSLAIAVIVEAILMQTSAEQVPSLHRVAPRYLKLVTSSNFWLFMLISVLMLFMLLVMILLFSVLTSTSYAVALPMSLLERSWSSPLLPPSRSSLTKCRLHMGLPPMQMDVWCSQSASCTILSRNKLNRMGENKHPWWTPTLVLNNFPSWLFKRTALQEFSKTAWMAWTSPSSMLKLLRTCHRSPC